MNKEKTRGWLGQTSIIKSLEQKFGDRAMKERLYLTPGSPRFIAENVEKLQFSLFLISCYPEILNSSSLSWYLLLKTVCLHVSFTAYKNFYKLSKMHCLLVWVSPFQPSEVSENRDPTIKHISTYTLISSSISTYVMDLFLVILFT